MSTDHSPQATDIAACIAEAAALIADGPVFDLDLDIGLEEDLPTLSCDPGGLRTALLNLLSNANDAVAGRGRIIVHAGRDAASGGLAIRVEDQGVGMSPATLARIFEPSFTTKCDGLGGCGLLIVESFASEAGGTIRIESRSGVGTIATLLLPPRTMRE